MKMLISFCLVMGLMVSLAVSASAAGPMSYRINGVGEPDYGSPTSIDVVHTADGGAMKNEDVSKNAALLPPSFGSASSQALNTGEYLTPNLAPGGIAVGVIGENSVTVYPPTTEVVVPEHSSIISTDFTDVTDHLYYSAGHLGTLKIPKLDLYVRIYQGTNSSTLAKGVGHFTETSIWNGNVALAAHNRGTNSYFGEIHTLELGDIIKLTTKLGSRNYEIFSVSKVSETDRSALSPSSENILTLYTCVRNQRDLRWCVQAREIV